MIALEELNRLGREAFVETLGAIFEHSPWVAERAASRRPFAARLDLLDAMREAVQAATVEEQLQLIRSHPKLGARGRSVERLTAASAREQHAAGLDACNDEEFALLQRLNVRYVDKFDFPFILAVRGHDPQSIIAAMESRLTHAAPSERQTALTQIGLIAGYRLADTVATPAGIEMDAMRRRLSTPGSGDLLREWILCAHLQAHPNAGESTAAITPKLGIRFDVHARSMCCEGELALLTAIAVAQRLRQRGMQPPYDLLVMARPAEAVTSNLSGFGYRADEALDVPALERAADLLQEFLIQASERAITTA